MCEAVLLFARGGLVLKYDQVQCDIFIDIYIFEEKCKLPDGGNGKPGAIHCLRNEEKRGGDVTFCSEICI